MPVTAYPVAADDLTAAEIDRWRAVPVGPRQYNFQYDTILLGLQTGVPPDPAMGQNVFRSSGRSHNWNISQLKPETPEEARIDQLMDTLVGSNDLKVRQQAWLDVENIVNEQAWYIWLPTLKAKIPMRNRFGNAKPSVIPHRLIWNIDTVFVKAQ